MAGFSVDLQALLAAIDQMSHFEQQLEQLLARARASVPSGNEAGANDQWVPGGLLPQGMPEAVIDGAEVLPDDYSVTDIPD